MIPAIPPVKSAPLKRVRLDDIQLETADDKKYIFRATSEDGEVEGRLEAEIQELADSMEKNGQLHPLILIQNGHGKYRILCGFRRLQALKRLKKEYAIAKIYQESDLTEEERIHISVAENARRRNLNPIEIGMFLQTARGNGKDKKTLSQLGQEFGEMLGIGTSFGSVNKYLKVNEMREKGESPEIINDVLKGQLAFGAAAEVLAFIGNAEDRNELYEQIVKPLKPTRPELKEIKNLLRKMGNGFKATLAKKEVKKAIKQAHESPHKGQELITLLRLQTGHRLTKLEKEFEDKVDALRKSVFGQDATKDEFNVIPPPGMEKNELTVHFKVTDESFDVTVDKMKKLLEGKEFHQLLEYVVKA
jgi:ParB family chromosome partitioning protein